MTKPVPRDTKVAYLIMEFSNWVGLQEINACQTTWSRESNRV
jgi:hypothetical protein